MLEITLAELSADAQREFCAAFTGFTLISQEIFAEEYYRGGFTIILSMANEQCKISYGDCEMTVIIGGTELFGQAVHSGFGGNMFSRENLKTCLPRIATSAADTFAIIARPQP